MIRFGLCCAFLDQPIKFANTTATSLAKLPWQDGRVKLARLCAANAAALQQALAYCAAHDIGCFRVNSQILPLKTHPKLGYDLEELPDGGQLLAQFRACREFAQAHALRICFHPDQFVVLNSSRPEVVEASLREIEYQAEVAEWIGADVVNIHAGGVFGDRPSAMNALAANLDRLSPRARARLTIENDDRLYSPADLGAFCRRLGVPLVYDVHHHRCHGDGLSVEQATELALATWDREPLFHISSPRSGWRGPRPECHHDYIHWRDFPAAWRYLDVTVEVEAKAKERAVRRLQRQFRRVVADSDLKQFTRGK